MKAKKNVFGRQKVHHFCKTTTTQIIGAATAAPAALLFTPLQLLCSQMMKVTVSVFFMLHIR